MLQLRSAGDSVLAARAARGDGPAFAELERRYRGLIWQTIGRPAFGLTYEDQHQEALIGLYAACRAHDPAHGGRFGGLATVCVRRCVWAARKRAKQPNHRILSEAVGLDVRDDHDDELPLSDRLSRGDQDDPAWIIELREELARLAVEGQRRPEPRPRRKPSKPRRYYTPDEVTTALELIAGGRTLREAAAEVGATHPTVLRWLRNAA